MSRHVILGTADGRRAMAGDMTALEPKPAKAKPQGSPAAEIFAGQLAARGVEFRAEVEFGRTVGRKWRADFVLGPAWVGGVLRPVIVEIDGGVHKLQKRFESDRAKARGAQALGYHFLPFTAEEVRLGGAVAQVAALYDWGNARCQHGR